MNPSNWQVLVVEDEPDSMELVRGILDHYGIQSVGAETGEDALDMMGNLTPTLFIIDLALPQIDGWGLLDEIKNNPQTSDVPCVAITAYYTPILANKAVKAGFNACFPKPINSRTFLNDLQAVLGG